MSKYHKQNFDDKIRDNITSFEKLIKFEKLLQGKYDCVEDNEDYYSVVDNGFLCAFLHVKVLEYYEERYRCLEDYLKRTSFTFGNERGSDYYTLEKPRNRAVISIFDDMKQNMFPKLKNRHTNRNGYMYFFYRQLLDYSNEKDEFLKDFYHYFDNIRREEKIKLFRNDNYWLFRESDTCL